MRKVLLWSVALVALLLWPEAAAGLLLVAGTLAVWAAAQPQLLVFAAGLIVGRRILRRDRPRAFPRRAPRPAASTPIRNEWTRTSP
ncbi:hypothetical protein [Streptomyces johnsoniae]|uniref:Uncharacterized protein n=1 Tax=Streptomyces johnsoniae TaxID=3075532 RepID=A0ABU2SAI0_9ACTN|nr:hypothetical protein [Streptomyces sp. DSM 41886]MDT0445960.1 hypothetical protein [Streptomyces sp. DSM 41886]